MNKKIIILLVTLLVFLVSVASASAVSDDNVKSADTSSKLAQNTHTTPNMVENKHIKEKEVKKVEKINKNVKTTGNVYVSSNGKGDGKTITTPTNITNALSMINNDDVINLVTSSSEDRYIKNIEISENTIKSGTDTFSIIGQTGKNIVINSTLNITKMKVNIKNINFTGKIGNTSIEGYNSSITIDNCTFTHDENVTLTFNDATTIDDFREIIYAINRYVNGLKGAIYNIDGNLVVTNSVFRDNYINAPEIISKLSITRINNAIEFYGAAIYNTGDNLKITNTLFDNNNVIDSPLFVPSDYWWEDNEIYGGAIYNTGDSMQITNSTFKDNSASDDGGAIYNDGKNSVISNSIFKDNKARNGGAIYNKGNDTVISNSSFTRNKASSGGAIINRDSNVKILNSNFTSNEAEYTGAVGLSQCTDSIISYNIFKHNKANESGAKTVIEVDEATVNIANNIGDKTSIFNQTIRFYESSGTVTYNNFTDKSQTIINVSPVKGIIGETITLKATLTDDNGDEINGGNLAFKLNGKTLRSDGRFDSNAPAMKFSVKNGLVTHTIKADLYLRNAKNLTASYSGTLIYNESTSESVTAQIQKRNAQVTVTTTPSKAKQYETLTFTIKAKDVTKNGKNTTLISDNTKVMLKVNGVTLKDNTGKTIIVTLDKNAQATYKYTIPAGTGGITASKAARNYKVDAIFVGDNYYPGARNTTSFQVERSPTTVTITQAKATNNNVLSVKATLKDYKGNNLIGTNKVTIKINGKSYTKNGKAVYWSVKNGNVDLTGIQVDPKTTIKRVLLVTGERQAYLEGRAETTTIIRG